MRQKALSTQNPPLTRESFRTRQTISTRAMPSFLCTILLYPSNYIPIAHIYMCVCVCVCVCVCARVCVCVCIYNAPNHCTACDILYTLPMMANHIISTCIILFVHKFMNPHKWRSTRRSSHSGSVSLFYLLMASKSIVQWIAGSDDFDIAQNHISSSYFLHGDIHNRPCEKSLHPSIGLNTPKYVNTGQFY